jgi:hypothetical protein
MVTFHELIDLLRSVGVDVNDLPVLLARKAGVKGAEKLAGASKAVIISFAKRIRSWHEHNQLESVPKDVLSSEEREASIRVYLERWINERQHDALETAKLLFRIVYLRSLRAHCNDLPVVANLGFVPQSLNDIWVEQDFRVAATGRLDATKVETRGSSAYSLEQAILAGGPRIIVEGPAGSGKSTQLRKFILNRISELLSLDDFEQFINESVPVYVNASDLLETQNDLATNLEAAVRSSLARRQVVEQLLIATGVIVRRSGRLEFIHYSFRSYLRAERLADLHPPSTRDVWSHVSPFRGDWDTVALFAKFGFESKKTFQSLWRASFLLVNQGCVRSPPSLRD